MSWEMHFRVLELVKMNRQKVLGRAKLLRQELKGTIFADFVLERSFSGLVSGSASVTAAGKRL